MLENKIFDDEDQVPAIHQSKKNAEYGFFTSRPFMSGLVSFFILLALFSLVIYQRYVLVREAKIKDSSEVVNLVKDKIEETITYSVSAAKTLSFYVDQNGTVHDFDSISAQILHAIIGIDALQLVPDGVIRYVYPLQENEVVIGYDILKDPTRNKEAFKAIEKKEMFFAGPFPLRQGGMGVVGRLPLYRQGKFWGFSAVIIKLSTLLKTAGIDSSGNNGYHFQLSKLNPDTEKEEYFLPVKNDQAQGLSVSVHLPDGEWKLSVINTQNYKGFGDVLLLAILGFLLSVMGGVFVYRFAIRPKKLDELVKKRTKELKNSENKYRSLIERVSDAFVSVDNDWNYTYINKRGGEIIGREPESLVGKNMWKEFPEGIDQPFYHAYYKARQTQEYQFFEAYYPPLDKWLENHVYPSADGITIFFKDITEIKKAETALKNNEEKYRSLIEQASDGIVITNLDGVIMEVNNSIKEMIGFGEKEMIGHHLTEYLPDSGNNDIPLRINELLKGESLLYERRLLRKDGSVLDVEINSRMASTHTLIGFIRDITERKKDETILLYQSRLLEGVSDAVTSLDMERRIISWNAACEDLYGLKAAEVIGRRIPDLMEFAYPETTNEEVFQQVFKDGQWKGEFYFIHPATKEKIDLLSSINGLFNKEGEVTGFIITSKDISERKVAEEALKKSNERFQLIAEATSDVIWDHDFSTNITWGNKNLYALYGIEPGLATITFEMFINQIHPDERDGIELRLDKAIENRVAHVSEQFRFKMADGEYRLFSDSAHIKYDDGGNPVRILGAMMDITEREEAQKIIRESEEKYRLIVEQASDGIFIADSNTVFLDANSAGCQMLGFSLEALRKVKIIDLIPAEDMITNPVQITKLKAGESMINERRLIRKDGSLIDVEISTKRLSDGRYQSMARDISERKKAEEKLLQSEKKYKLLFNNNPLPMWMTTLPGLDIIDVNEAAIKQYGYSREEFLKLNSRSLRPAEDLDYFLAEVDKMESDKINIRAWRHKRKDGSVLNVETYSHEILYEGKRVWLLLSHDVTEKHEAKEQLQKSYEDIRQLASNLQSIREDERTNIAREIHDELGQQLTGLKMDMHWLLRKIKSADTEVIKKMDESIELINATIRSVRKISTDLRPSILDDLGLLAALEWQSEEFQKRSGIKVEFVNNVGDMQLRPDVSTAVFRIYQELLTNIARHANANHANAELNIEGDQLKFTITDDGVGFDPEKIKNKKTLGLLGIKERSLILGGTYEFHSIPGKGSQTHISIPIGKN